MKPHNLTTTEAALALAGEIVAIVICALVIPVEEIIHLVRRRR